MAAGSDPYELVRAGVAAAAALSGAARPREQKEVPPSADVFGWCTWDGAQGGVGRGLLRQPEG